MTGAGLPFGLRLPDLTPRRWLGLAGSLLPVPLLLLTAPLGMTAAQCLTLGALITVLVWWVTGLVERTVASLVLLAVFLLGSGASAGTVFSFPRSENFAVIVLAFLFSQGIANSGLADRLLLPLLFRFGGSRGRLLALMALCALGGIFLVPQPFSRVIILALIFKSYFDKINVNYEARQALLFGLFGCSAFVNMLMLRGDLILNGALVSMGGVSITEGDWMAYMLVPTAVFIGLCALLYLLVFRRELDAYDPGPAPAPSARPLTAGEKGRLLLILAVVVLWALEDLHGVSGVLVAGGGVAAMFACRLLRLRDLKCINLRLLVFLTAAFAVGGVLKQTGVADVIFLRLTALFPSRFSVGYAALVLGVSMALHMLLGSNVTTMSVAVPGLMSVGAGVVQEEVLLFLIYLGVCGHFLLPFHHVLLLLGEGDGCYTSRHMTRFGLPLTALTLLCGLVLYLGWWRLAGLL